MELPFNFVPKTIIKSAQAMANFNALKNAVTTIENTLVAGVPKVAAAVVGKTQLAAGFNQKRTTGNFNVEIPAGGIWSGAATFAHGLGEVPTQVNFTVHAPLEYGITFAFHVSAWDGANVTGNLHASTAIPGVAPATFGITWEAIGQP